MIKQVHKAPQQEKILINIKYKRLDDGDYGFELFWRAGDKIIKTIDKSFHPYFYTIPPEEYNDERIKRVAEKIKKIKIISNNEEVTLVDVKIEEKIFQNKKRKCIKVCCKGEKDIMKIKRKIKAMFNTFHNRDHDVEIIPKYLVEKKLGFFDHNYKPKVCAFDIEGYDPELGIKKDFENDHITMIGFYGKDFQKTLTWHPTKLKNVEVCKDEKEMLKRFFEIINSGKFDIFVTYNGNDFDLPFIKKRAEVLGLPEAKEIEIFNRGWRTKSIFNGALHVDLYDVVSRHNPYLHFSSYSLNDVAEKIIGQKKKEFDILESKSQWDDGNIDKYIEYNKQDAKITYLLAERVMPIEYELSSLVFMSLDHSSRQGFSRLVEEHLIKKALENNYLVSPIPNKEEMKSRYEKTYEGAFVLEPKPGLYKDVIDLDFRSLYPSIIDTFNIDPFTQTKQNENSYACPDGKHFFSKEPKGFIPKVIDDLIKERIEIKKKLKQFTKISSEEEQIRYEKLDFRQKAIKVLTNSIYGYMGFIAARYYCFPCVKAATAWGRYYIKKTISEYKNKGFKVLYGDTDSLLVTGDKQKILELTTHVNDNLPGIMHLKQDAFFKKILFVGTEEHGTKKKYAAIDSQGKLIVKGFELVRGDWCNLARKTQEKIILLCLKDNVEKAYLYTKEVLKKLEKKEIPIKDLVIYKKLSRNPEAYTTKAPHVVVGKMLGAKKGDIVGYVIVPGGGSISEEARPYKEAKTYNIDYYKYHQIIPSALRILGIFGYKKQDFEESKQKTIL